VQLALDGRQRHVHDRQVENDHQLGGGEHGQCQRPPTGRRRGGPRRIENSSHGFPQRLGYQTIENSSSVKLFGKSMVGRNYDGGMTTTADRALALTYQLNLRVLRLHDQIKAHAAGLTRQLGLSEALADVLWQLDPKEEPVPMRELAARRGCDPSTVTLLADRLEERRLVERRPDPVDRRVKNLAITPAGVAVRERLVHGAVAESPLSRLSATEQRQLNRLLGKAIGESG
jgi:DNA-binding MarR family transcriptional regulator